MKTYTVQEAGRKGGKSVWKQDLVKRKEHAQKIGEGVRLAAQKRHQAKGNDEKGNIVHKSEKSS